MMDFNEYWRQISATNDELNSLLSSYWSSFSSMGSWQFWVVFAFLVLPLILLYFKLDRRRVFEIFFFGLIVHLLWSYVDQGLASNNYFIHTYFLSPLYPSALSITASLLPVGFLLLYQHCTNTKKNFYLYTLFLAAAFSFGFASAEEYVGLVEFRNGMNQFYLFVIDVIIVYIAYWFTLLIKKFKQNR